MGRKEVRTESRAVSNPAIPPSPEKPTVVVVDENTAKGVEMMSDSDLVAIHEQLCSGEPPFCMRTYHPRDYRAHVLLLIAEKQKQIA